MEKTNHAALAGEGGVTVQASKERIKLSSSAPPPPTPGLATQPTGAGFWLAPGPRLLCPPPRTLRVRDPAPLPRQPRATGDPRAAPRPLPPTRNRNWPVGGTRAMASGRGQVGRGGRRGRHPPRPAGGLARASPGPSARGAGAPTPEPQPD